MVVILGLVVSVAFGWYWWRGTAYGAFAMMFPMIPLWMFVGSCVEAALTSSFVDDGEPAGLLVGLCLGVASAWGPYRFKARRLGLERSWRRQTMASQAHSAPRAELLHEALKG